MNIYLLEGLLGGLALYNFFLYYIINEKSYLHYSLTIFWLCIYFLVNTFAIPTQYWILGKYANPQGIIAQMSVIGFWWSFFHFCSDFLQIKAKYKHAYTFFLLTFWVSLVFYLLHWVGIHVVLNILLQIHLPLYLCHVNAHVADTLLLLSLIALLYINVKEYFAKNPSAFYFFWANLSAISTGILFIVVGIYAVNMVGLGKNEAKHINEILFSIFQGGVSLQMILFAVALADRINLLRKAIADEKVETAFTELKKNQEIQEILAKQNQALDQKVKERTSELQEKNQALETISEELQSSLEQREWLLKEMHHRVKNNLQIVSSILRLQSRKIQDNQALNIIKDGQNRVQSIALIHQKLYQTENIVKVDCEGYILDLVKYLENAYLDKHKKITLSFDIQKNILLDVEKVVSMGLIINELVSNVFKYAFPNINEGTIWIHFNKKADPQTTKQTQTDTPTEKYMLMVADNGIGLDKEIDLENSKTLGLDLVHTLTQQLKGEIKVVNQPKKGLRFELVF